MPSHLHNQSRLLDRDGPPACPHATLCFRGLRILIEIVSQELTHIRRPVPPPSNGKDFAG
jgi:hypothetical protein